MTNKIRSRLLIFMTAAMVLFTSGCSAALENQPQQGNTQQTNDTSYTLDSIPEYSGSPYAVLDDNQPSFPAEDLIEQSFEKFGELDSIGRCSTAYANLSKETMPTEDRGAIGMVKPTGWHTVKYDCVDGKYLYNRCHLICFQLSGENANEQNLITGTRYMNVDGMLPFENMVADYIKETDNHVLYRVTPVFKGDNLLSSGVIMEAQSVEDSGEGISFKVYVYNAQPGVTIDYATGESYLSEESADEPSASESETEIRGNSSSKIYHMPGQQAYEQMGDSKNLVIFHSEKEAQEAGYRKAKR